jgi:hypothetical protein
MIRVFMMSSAPFNRDPSMKSNADSEMVRIAAAASVPRYSVPPSHGGH